MKNLEVKEMFKRNARLVANNQNEYSNVYNNIQNPDKYELLYERAQEIIFKVLGWCDHTDVHDNYRLLKDLCSILYVYYRTGDICIAEKLCKSTEIANYSKYGNDIDLFINCLINNSERKDLIETILVIEVALDYIKNCVLIKKKPL